jgi:hypothetical protein
MSESANNSTTRRQGSQRGKTAPASDASAPPSAAASPPARPAPINSLGSLGYFGPGAVNLDHFLGGMPIELPPLPPSPDGFKEIHGDLKRTSPWPFSTHPLPPRDLLPPPAPAEPPSLSPFLPIKPAPPEPAAAVAKEAPPAPAEPLSPSPSAPIEPAPPEPTISVETKSPPPPPKITAIPRNAVLRSASQVRRKSLPSTTRTYESPLDDGRAGNTRAINPAADADLAHPPAASDGLAVPSVRHTDVFSNFDAAPMNDAAFGGLPLNRSDDFILPESPGAAERLADGAERDFADDEFWNRTDEEDDGERTNPVDPPNPIPDRGDAGEIADRDTSFNQ